MPPTPKRDTFVVGVVSPEGFSSFGPLFRALSGFLPLRFEARGLDKLNNLDGLIVLEGDANAASRLQQSTGLPCFSILGRLAKEADRLPGQVSFSKSPHVPPCLRGETFEETENRLLAPLQVPPGWETLASKDGVAVWISRAPEQGSARLDLVSLSPPHLAPGEYLCDYFHRHNFLRLVPLFSFLQSITARDTWSHPPAQACLVIDDPNLRWKSYGCLDFEELASAARDLKFHAAIATIPIDTWWISHKVSRLFKENKSSLSLIVHGNDHTDLEMVRLAGDAEQTERLAQALRRVDRLRRRHGLEVFPVLESPYGVMDAGLALPLVNVGFEAALITPRQFLRHNKDEQIPLWHGLGRVESLDHGLGLIPRIVLAPKWRTEVLLTALLGQPIVVAGHHYDAEEGSNEFLQAAATINSIPGVTWAPVGAMARSAFKTRIESKTLFVYCASRHIELEVPPGVTSAVVERSWMELGAEADLLLCGPGGKQHRSMEPAASRPREVRPGRLVIHSPAVSAVSPVKVRRPKRRFWPFVRRALTEARDRTYPILPRRRGIASRPSAGFTPEK